MSQIGHRIRELRKQFGLSGQKLADKAGIGQSTLSDIERGLKNPTIDTLESIARALGIPLTHFFETTESEFHPQLTRLIEVAKRLSPEQCEAVTTLIETLVPINE